MPDRNMAPQRRSMPMFLTIFKQCSFIFSLPLVLSTLDDIHLWSRSRAPLACDGQFSRIVGDFKGVERVAGLSTKCQESAATTPQTPSVAMVRRLGCAASIPSAAKVCKIGKCVTYRP